MSYEFLIPSENIPSIHFFLYIIQYTIIAVGDDSLTLFLERLEVVHYPATEEEGAVQLGRLLNDDRSTLCLDAFHHPLDGTLSKIVATRFHGEAVDSNHWQFRVMSDEF